jgi:hypothetical protein
MGDCPVVLRFLLKSALETKLREFKLLPPIIIATECV